MGEGQQVFIGRLGKNPELAYTRKQMPVCEMSLALEKQVEGKTIWKRVLVWGRLAEVCSVHLRKGNSVFIKGEIQIREYEDRLGQKKIIEELVANKVALSLI